MNRKATYAVSEVTLPTTATRLDYTPPEGFTRDNSIPVAAILKNSSNSGWYKDSETVLMLTHTGRVDMKDYTIGLRDYGGQPCKILHILL